MINMLYHIFFLTTFARISDGDVALVGIIFFRAFIAKIKEASAIITAYMSFENILLIENL